MLKFVVLKIWKLTHGQQKFFGKILSNPNGGFLTPETQKNLNNDYKFQKWKVQILSEKC